MTPDDNPDPIVRNAPPNSGPQAPRNDIPSEALFFGVSFNNTDRSVRSFGRADLERELHDSNVFSWINIQGADISALNEVLRTLDIDLVLVGHFNTPEILPRIVERPDCLAFYLYEIGDPDRHLDTSRGLTEFQYHRMILVLGAHFVITFHRYPLAAVEYVKSACAESFRLAAKTPGFIVFLFLQRCLHDYAHLNLANDNYLDALEEGVLAGDPAGLQEQITLAGKNILTLKRLVASSHIALMLLADKRSPFVSPEARASFHEMLQSATAIRAAVDSSRDLLDGVLHSAQAAAAHRTSEIARVLTITSAVILPLSLVAGIYGMNFEKMPELKWEYGYFTVLILMALLAGALLLFFRRLGWYGDGRAPARKRSRDRLR